MIFGGADAVPAELIARFEPVPDNPHNITDSRKYSSAEKQFLSHGARQVFRHRLPLPRTNRHSPKEDRHRIKILREGVNRELMPTESLIWQEIRSDLSRSKLKSDGHSSVANGSRTDLDVGRSLLSLGRDLPIHHKHIHQGQGLDVTRDCGSADLLLTSLGGRRWGDV